MGGERASRRGRLAAAIWCKQARLWAGRLAGWPAGLAAAWRFQLSKAVDSFYTAHHPPTDPAFPPLLPLPTCPPGLCDEVPQCLYDRIQSFGGTSLIDVVNNQDKDKGGCLVT